MIRRIEKTMRRYLVIVILALMSCLWCGANAAERDLFQQTVNYVFTGNIDPPDAPEIVDRTSCIVVMPDPNVKRFIRYYLNRFKINEAFFNETYAGNRVLHDLEIQSDNTVIEYLNLDKTTVIQGYKSAHIPLPGDIDQTKRAIHIIFSDFCKADQSKTPF